MSKESKIKITGMGIISPLGNDIPTFWNNLCAGKSGIGPLTVCDLADFAFQDGGEVKNIPLPAEFKNQVPANDRALQMLVAATAQAINQAPIANPTRTAVVLSTNFASAGTFDKDLGLDSPWSEAELGFQNATDTVAEIWELSGPKSTLSLSCSSGSAAIGYGVDLIKNGHADCVIAGGYDSISRFAWAGLGLLRTMTEDMVRPFDKNRAGTQFSEGAGVVILEKAGTPSPALAEVSGFGFNNNAYHMTAPPQNGQGIADTMLIALKEAGIKPEEVDHINTHGTGTQLNDITETQAIKQVLGDHAYDAPITSIKSMTGHLMGAAGSAETIATVLSMQNNKIPPTINMTEPDPECDLPIPTDGPMEKVINIAITNSSGIGGNNVSLLLKKIEE